MLFSHQFNLGGSHLGDMEILSILGIGISFEESFNLYQLTLLEQTQGGGVIILNPCLDVKDSRELDFLVILFTEVLYEIPKRAMLDFSKLCTSALFTTKPEIVKLFIAFIIVIFKC